MNNEPTKGVLEKLDEGQKFFFKFSRCLQKLDFKDFSLGVIYKFLVQTLSLVATLLPIKILLFLAPNRNVPEILVEFFDTKSQFVISLCCLMFVFMFLAYVFSKLAARITKIKVNKIVSMSKTKVVKHKIRKTIDNCMMIYSSSLFLVCCMALEIIVYIDLVFILTVVLLITFVVLSAEKNNKIPVLKTITNPPYKLFSNIAQFLFIGSFLFIVYDVLVNEVQRSFIELIVGLILLRQSSMLISKICSLLVELDLKKERSLELIKAVE